jgi:exopolysaccharide biosynthesis polyprenyl glycosylphosphotransferase
MTSSSGSPSLSETALSTGGETLKHRRKRRRFRQFFFAILLPCLDAGLWLGIYFGLSTLTGSYNQISASSYLIPLLTLMGCIGTIGGYRPKTDFLSLRYASEHLIAGMIGLSISALVVFFFVSFGPNPTSSRGIFIASVILFALGSLIIRRRCSSILMKGESSRKFLVIVDEKIGPVFYRDYQASDQREAIHYAAAKKELRGNPVAGPGTPAPIVELTHLLPHLDRESASNYEGIVVAADLAKLDERVLQRLGVINFEEIPVYSSETFYETFWKRIPIELISPAWPLESEFNLVQHSNYASVKSLFDIVIALAALIIALPLFLVTALLILLLDGRPIFYTQPRVGLHQRVFKLFKFRTMKIGSDKGDGYTREGDSRVTALGGILRRTRLDELPQLLNVLRGDMSIIGPRAEWTRLVAGYEEQIPNYHFRHLVRPGITGWAQVNYPYGANLEDTLQKLSYDLYYIRNFSLLLDAEVILKTLHVMTFAKGR